MKNSWVVKTRKTSEAVLRPNIPIGHHTMGLGQYNSLGEHSGPNTASSVFLIQLFGMRLGMTCGVTFELPVTDN